MSEGGSSKLLRAPLSTAEMVEKAVALYQRGRVVAAARLYRAVLKTNPDHFAALQGMGVISAQQGRLDEALRLFGEALAQDPNSATAHNNLATLLQMRNRNQEAIEHYERAVALKPDYAEAYSNFGNALRACNRHDEAMASYRKALELSPDYAEAHYNLGKALQELGRLDEAVASYERAGALKPGYAAAHNNLGTVLHALNRLNESVAAYEKALACNPDYAEAHNNLGAVLIALERPTEAIPHFERAVALKPGYAAAHNNLGTALQSLERHAEALPSHETALALNPDYPDAHNDLANALGALGRHAEGIAHYERAIELRPNYPEAFNNLGNALQSLGRLEEAIACYHKALALRPDYFGVYSNLGNIFVAMNRHAEAIALYTKALAIKPDFAQAQFNEGLARLVLGDFAEGWSKYEWRWLHRGSGLHKPDLRQPMWVGDQDLAGKTILLYAEQGFGDTLQFVRYVPMVARRGGRVVLHVQKPLASLLAAMPGVAAVCIQGDPLPPLDCHCPLMSLPLLLHTRFETIPAEVPYLAAPAKALARWRSRLRPGRGLQVGLVWAGSTTHRNDHNRSVPLDLLRPLLATPDVRFISLQKEIRARDAELLRSFRGVKLIGDQLTDFGDTAAVVSQLDLVITADTAVAHLAGALGKPVWIMVPFSPDWRWLVGRADSPWYPTARLFRQKATGDWRSVVTPLHKALKQRVRRSARAKLLA